jgi:hypothetical protein
MEDSDQWAKTSLKELDYLCMHIRYLVRVPVQEQLGLHDVNTRVNPTSQYPSLFQAFNVELTRFTLSQEAVISSRAHLPLLAPRQTQSSSSFI